MNNIEWIDLLSKEWQVSRSVAKEMLHNMYLLKRIDILNKERDNKIIDYVKRDITICEGVNND